MFSLWRVDVDPSLALWALAAAVVGAALLSGGLKALTAPLRLDAALGSLLALVLLWAMQARVDGPVGLSLSGAGLVTLMFGLRGALLLLAAATALSGAALSCGLGLAPDPSDVHPAQAAAQFLLGGALPALLTRTLAAAVQRGLPNHLFVYLLAHGFFATGLAGAGGLALTALWLDAMAVIPATRLYGEILPTVLLLASGEGFLAGGLTAIFVVYRPQWMLSFQDARYLWPKPAARGDGDPR